MEMSYGNVNECKDALVSGADIVVLMLGTNDCQPHNWKKGEFIESLDELVNLFSVMNSKPKVFVCRPPPLYAPGYDEYYKEMLSHLDNYLDQSSHPHVHGIIDVNNACCNEELFPDLVHPNVAGCTQIASAVAGQVV